MAEYRSLLERARSNFPPPELPLEDVLRGRHRRAWHQRVAAGIVGMGIFATIVVIVSTVGLIDDRARVPQRPGAHRLCIRCI